MHRGEGQSDISPLERGRRAALLREIEERIYRFGPHEARAHADRARQFVPFAALKGYENMAKSREFVPCRQHELTEEESLAFSKTMASLSKGDAVRVHYHENGRRVIAEGAVVSKDETLHTMRVGKTDIPFERIEKIERP